MHYNEGALGGIDLQRKERDNKKTIVDSNARESELGGLLHEFNWDVKTEV